MTTKSTTVRRDHQRKAERDVVGGLDLELDEFTEQNISKMLLLNKKLKKVFRLIESFPTPKNATKSHSKHRVTLKNASKQENDLKIAVDQILENFGFHLDDLLNNSISGILEAVYCTCFQEIIYQGPESQNPKNVQNLTNSNISLFDDYLNDLKTTFNTIEQAWKDNWLKSGAEFLEIAYTKKCKKFAESTASASSQFESDLNDYYSPIEPLSKPEMLSPARNQPIQETELSSSNYDTMTFGAGLSHKNRFLPVANNGNGVEQRSEKVSFSELNSMQKELLELEYDAENFEAVIKGMISGQQSPLGMPQLQEELKERKSSGEPPCIEIDFFKQYAAAMAKKDKVRSSVQVLATLNGSNAEKDKLQMSHEPGLAGAKNHLIGEIKDDSKHQESHQMQDQPSTSSQHHQISLNSTNHPNHPEANNIGKSGTTGSINCIEGLFSESVSQGSTYLGVSFSNNFSSVQKKSDYFDLQFNSQRMIQEEEEDEENSFQLTEIEQKKRIDLGSSGHQEGNFRVDGEGLDEFVGGVGGDEEAEYQVEPALLVERFEEELGCNEKFRMNLRDDEEYLLANSSEFHRNGVKIEESSSVSSSFSRNQIQGLFGQNRVSESTLMANKNEGVSRVGRKGSDAASYQSKSPKIKNSKNGNFSEYGLNLAENRYLKGILRTEMKERGSGRALNSDFDRTLKKKTELQEGSLGFAGKTLKKDYHQMKREYVSSEARDHQQSQKIANDVFGMKRHTESLEIGSFEVNTDKKAQRVSSSAKKSSRNTKPIEKVKIGKNEKFDSQTPKMSLQLGNSASKMNTKRSNRSTSPLKTHRSVESAGSKNDEISQKIAQFLHSQNSLLLNSILQTENPNFKALEAECLPTLIFDKTFHKRVWELKDDEDSLGELTRSVLRANLQQPGFYDLALLPEKEEGPKRQSMSDGGKREGLRLFAATTEGDIKYFDYGTSSIESEKVVGSSTGKFDRVRSYDVLKTLDLIKDLCYVDTERIVDRNGGTSGSRFGGQKGLRLGSGGLDRGGLREYGAVRGLVFSQLQQGVFFIPLLKERDSVDRAEFKCKRNK